MTKNEALEFIASHNFDGADDRAIALMAKFFVYRAKEALAQPAQELDEAAIRADEREACAAHYLTIMRKAIANEREACAKVVEADPSYDWHKFACEAAAVIRARGNT